MSKLSLSHLLKENQKPPLEEKDEAEKEISQLQLEMLRIQQGIWHGKGRAVLVFEGFDAAGKGGCIRTLTACLDPRGVAVHPVGPPTQEELGQHYLQRFWRSLPEPGTIAIFDRSWYGRVLVEKVEKLAKPSRIKDAYREIQEFERMLADDGITLLKFFLAISPEEQLRRFEERLSDPYKQWKLGEPDLEARRKWPGYVDAVDKLLKETDRKHARWHLVPADHKHGARIEVMRTCVKALGDWGDWIRKKAAQLGTRSLQQELKAVEKKLKAGKAR